MPRRRSILMIEGQSDPISLSVARCLAATPGVALHTVAVDQHSQLRYSRHRASFRIQANSFDSPQLLDELRQLVRETGAELILPVMEPAVQYVAANRAALAAIAALAPNPDLATFRLVSDKWKLAHFLAQRGLPCPPTVRYSPEPSFFERVAALRFPVLLKPATARGGRDIRRFQTYADLVAYCEARGPFREPFIVQSFVEGYDIDCSVLCQDGRILAYTQQRGLLENHTPFAPAQGIALVHDARLLAVTERLVAELGWSGVAHIDLRYDQADGTIKVIELNPRYWNTMLGSQLAGVNFPDLACRAALGRPFPRPTYTDGRYVPFSVAFGQALRGLQGREHLAFRLGETNLRYVLADPLPSLMRGLARLRSRKAERPAVEERAPVTA